MRLAQFIDQAQDEIVAESVVYAAEISALHGVDERALRDHLPLVLETISRDLEILQSLAQSIEKSLGRGPVPKTETAAQTHGKLRAQSGLNVEQLVAEYRVLRSSVLRLWARDHEPDQHVIEDTLRFNEAIDQAIAESVAFHSTEIAQWRSLLLGILGDDLRSPLNAMLLTADLLTYKTSGETADLAAALLRHGHRLVTLLDSLLAYNKATLGLRMEIHREDVDLGSLCQEEIEILRLAFPQRRIVFEVTGDTHGCFDGSRVREALTNLVSNAAQHSPEGTVITVGIEGGDAMIEIFTENAAEAISPDVMATLFDPLRRHSTERRATAGNLGLGLFIVREIARAHGGEVTALADQGSIRFRLVLPKMAVSV